MQTQCNPRFRKPLGDAHKSWRSLLCAAGFVLFAWESPVSAQAKPTREGGWLSLGVGYGSARVSCDTCQTGRHTDGLDVLLAIGGTPSPHWCAGAMLEVWEHWFPGGDTLKEMTNGTISAYYYPWVRAGLFLEGGLGLADFRMLKGLHEGILFENADRIFVKGFGWSATGAIGYDLHLSHHYVLKPRVAYTHGGIGTLHTPAGTPAARRWNQNVLSVGLGLSLVEGS